MCTLAKIRDALLVLHADGLIDDEELLVLLRLNKKNIHFHIGTTCMIDLTWKI